MKLKQQQQRHEKRSEKYQKMGVKKIEGEKSWRNWEEGLLNKTERECKWIIGKKNVQSFTLTLVFPISMLLSLTFLSVVLTKRITLFDNQELLKSVIISFILMTFTFDLRLIK